jgi:hypothetical protein
MIERDGNNFTININSKKIDVLTYKTKKGRKSTIDFHENDFSNLKELFYFVNMLTDVAEELNRTDNFQECFNP